MKLLPFLLLPFIISSCTTIYFTEAQPKDTKSIDEFPKEIQASYLSDTDTFTIESKAYTFPVVYESTVSLNEVDSNPKLHIKDGLYFDEDMPFKDGIVYTSKNDSIYYKKHVRGSKKLSDSLILKKYKKLYVLSELENESGYWTVMILKIKGGNIDVLMTGHIKTEDDTGPDSEYDVKIEDFEKITEFKKLDTHTYLIDPSSSEFKKLISKDLFSSIIELKRISAP